MRSPLASPRPADPLGGKPVLCLEGITKDFEEASGPLRVLRGATLRVSPGEVIVLQGPSGSGKTTLLQIAGCLLRPTSGRVELLGQELAGASESVRVLARRRHLGFVFQQFHLVQAVSVYDNVALGFRLKGQAIDKNRVEMLLDELGIASRRPKLPRYLSGGEKQRTAIARALAGRPDLILADEPTSQLDSTSAQTVCELLSKTVRHASVAAIITTHDTRVHSIADRVLTLKEGMLHE